MGIFRKKPYRFVAPDGNDRLNLVDELHQESIKNGQSEITVLVKHSVPCCHMDMPTVQQYDLEEMLKAGYKPEQINVNGMLEASDGFNASDAFNRISKPFDKSDDSVTVQNDDSKIE